MPFSSSFFPSAYWPRVFRSYYLPLPPKINKMSFDIFMKCHVKHPRDPKGIYKGDVIWTDTISKGKSSFQPSFIQGANGEFSGGVNSHPDLGIIPNWGTKSILNLLLMAEILHQLRLVVFPIIYRVSAPSFRWLGMGFQPSTVSPNFRTFKPPGMHLLLSLEMVLSRLGVPWQFAGGNFLGALIKRKRVEKKINQGTHEYSEVRDIRLYQVLCTYSYSLIVVVVTLSGTFALLFLIGTFKKGRTK